MVALPTPARAATSSTQTPSNPCSANTSRVASMMAWSAASLRGRPSRRTDPAVTGSTPVWMSGSATVTGCMVVSHLPLSGLDHVFFHYGQLGVVVTVLRAPGRHRLGPGKHRLGRGRHRLGRGKHRLGRPP